MRRAPIAGSGGPGPLQNAARLLTLRDAFVSFPSNLKHSAVAPPEPLFELPLESVVVWEPEGLACPRSGASRLEDHSAKHQLLWPDGSLPRRFCAFVGALCDLSQCHDALLPHSIETYVCVHLSLRIHIGFAAGDILQVVDGEVVLSAGEAMNGYIRSGSNRGHLASL